jgi:hypothetical protein
LQRWGLQMQPINEEKNDKGDGDESEKKKAN